MKKLLAALVAVGALVLATASPGGAIVGGEVDGENHPNVAIIYMQSAEGRFRCSATLISPTVLLTAAHCTEGTLGKVLGSFSTSLPASPPRPADPAAGYQTGEVPGFFTGTAYTHPEWDGELQLNDLHDVGIVVLDEPVSGITPATLAPEGFLDTLSVQQLHQAAFMPVGYGVHFEKPASGKKKPTAVAPLVRQFAISPGQNLTSQVIKLAEADTDSRGTGGTCFGDSGGPLFSTLADGSQILVADTSFGGSQFCQGMGGYYRLDTEDARDFVGQFVTLP